MMQVSEPYRPWIERHGWWTIEDVMNDRRGTVINGHRRRTVAVDDLPTGEQACRMYIKRCWHQRWKHVLRDVLTGHSPQSLSHREWQLMLALQAKGIGCPEPIAMGQESGWGPHRRSFLITRDVAQARPLAQFLRSQTQPTGELASRAARTRFFSELAEAVRRFHDSGFDHPDLYSKHILVHRNSGDQPRWQFSFIDLERTRQRKSVSYPVRIRDLGALDATLSPTVMSSSDRLRFLMVYLDRRKIDRSVARTTRAICKERDRRLKKRKVRAMRHESQAAHQTNPQRFTLCKDGVLVVTESALAALHNANLDSFAALYQTGQGEQLRQLPDRSNTRLELDGRTWYLKRHRGHTTIWDRLRRLFGKKIRTPGRIEWENLGRLCAASIPCSEAGAFGEKLYSNGTYESLFLTPAREGYLPLDDLLKQRRGLLPEERRRLLANVLKLVRGFHEQGLNHRDLYACHIFAHPLSLAVYLIDLQRVQRRKRFRRRWLVKDLAALDYSLAGLVTRTEKLRFLLSYCGQASMTKDTRRWITRIRKKTARLEARQPA